MPSFICQGLEYTSHIYVLYLALDITTVCDDDDNEARSTIETPYMSTYY